MCCSGHTFDALWIRLKPQLAIKVNNCSSIEQSELERLQTSSRAEAVTLRATAQTAGFASA